MITPEEREAKMAHANELREKGICVHNFYDRHIDGTVKCVHCGKFFSSMASHEAELLKLLKENP